MNKRFIIIFLPIMVGLILTSSIWQVFAQEPNTVQINRNTPEDNALLFKQIGGNVQAVAKQGDYAFVGIGSRLEVYDVQDPANPIFIAQTPKLTSTVPQLALVGNVAYAPGTYGLQIFDLSDPYNPVLAAIYDLPSRKTNDLFVSGTTLYLAESKNSGTFPGSGGLRILDISNPLAPVELGLYGDGYRVNAVATHLGYAYLELCQFTDPNSCLPGFAVVDVSNPASPVEVSFWNTTMGDDVGVHGNYLYRVVNADGELLIFNISNPSTPLYANELNIYVRQFNTHGNMAYVTSYAGLYLYDLSDPVNPTLYGSYWDNAFLGPFGVAMDNDYAYIAYGTGGLRIADTSQPTLPEAGRYDTFGQPRDVAQVGDYVYLLDYEFDLHILDVSDPENPLELQRYDHGNWDRQDLVLEDSLGFLVGWDGFEIIDVTDPLSPTHHAIYNSPGFNFASQVIISGSYAFVSNLDHAEDSLEIVDISDPDNPALVASIGENYLSGEGLALAGHYVFLNEADAGYGCDSQLTVIDVSDPLLPQVVATRPLSYSSSSLAIINDFAYVGGYGVAIFDVLSPTNPIPSGTYTMTNAEGWDYMVREKNNLLYVSAPLEDDTEAQLILDVTNPTNPVAVGSYEYVDDLNIYAVDDVYTYAPMATDGLFIYVTPNLPPEVDAGPDMAAAEGELIQFNATAVGADIYQIVWDFGDGTSSGGTLTPEHAYGDNGTFLVTLTVTNAVGLSGSDQLTVTTYNVGPTVYAGGDQNGALGEPLAFSGTFTDAGVLDTHAITWDFGDGLTTTGTLTPTHIYTTAGLFTTTLTIMDDDGDSGSDTAVIYVYQSPTVEAGADVAAAEGSLIQFNGTVDDEMVTDIIWNFGDGHIITGTLTPEYAYGDDGNFTVTLTVTNAVGLSDTDTLAATIDNVAPTVEAGPDQSGVIASPISLTGVINDPGWLDTHAVAWDFGDGITTTGTLTPVHTFTTIGTFTVTLTATDDEGAGGVDTAVITITEAAISGLAATADSPTLLGEATHFTVTVTGGSNVVYHWDFGDGQTAMGANPTHIYAAAGPYTVTVTAENSVGSASYTLEIIVIEPNHYLYIPLLTNP